MSSQASEKRVFVVVEMSYGEVVGVAAVRSTRQAAEQFMEQHKDVQPDENRIIEGEPFKRGRRYFYTEGWTVDGDRFEDSAGHSV